MSSLGVSRTNPEGGIRVLIKTPKGRFSGYQAFIQANQLARSVGQNVIIRSPLVGIAAPNSPVQLRASFDGAKLTVQWDDIPVIKTEQYVRIWARSEQKRFHRQIVGIIQGSAKAIDIIEVRANKGVGIAVSTLGNTAVLIQADTVDKSTGWASNPSLTKRLYLEV